jgi:hypothetical protein
MVPGGDGEIDACGHFHCTCRGTGDKAASCHPTYGGASARHQGLWALVTRRLECYAFTVLTERKRDCTWSVSSVHAHLLGQQFDSVLVSCLSYSSTPKIEATCSSETSVDFQRTTRCYFPEDKNSIELVALPLSIRNIPGSNFSLETRSSDWGARRFPQFLQGRLG